MIVAGYFEDSTSTAAVSEDFSLMQDHFRSLSLLDNCLKQVECCSKLLEMAEEEMSLMTMYFAFPLMFQGVVVAEDLHLNCRYAQHCSWLTFEVVNISDGCSCELEMQLEKSTLAQSCHRFCYASFSRQL